MRTEFSAVDATIQRRETEQLTPLFHYTEIDP
jgi:hypothetical protein